MSAILGPFAWQLMGALHLEHLADKAREERKAEPGAILAVDMEAGTITIDPSKLWITKQAHEDAPDVDR